MMSAAELNTVNDDGVGMEFDEVEPAEGGGVLVLLAPGDSQVDSLDLVIQSRPSRNNQSLRPV